MTSKIKNRLVEIVESWDIEFQYSFNERAAIMQYDGGLLIREAERKAFKIVNKERKKVEKN